MGVPVVGFGSEELPAFYCRESGLKVDYVVDDEVEAAEVIRTKWDLGLKSGILIANPIPEEEALPRSYVNRIINKAVLEAARKGIKGKSLTPYLLGRINELSEGKSLTANIALIKNNARVGAKIACELIR
jgi:pseudouridine-5'-phosphate glycosidase